MDRPVALRTLSWAAIIASLPVPINGDAYQRVASVLSGLSRLDAQTIERIEAVLWHCRRQDHALGPQAA